MAVMARWALRHPWVMIPLWLAAMVGVFAAGTLAGSSYSDNFDMPGSEASEAAGLMEKALPERSGDTATIVWQVQDGKVTDPAVREAMIATLADVNELPDVGDVQGPYDERGQDQISKDETIAYATVTFTKATRQLDTDLLSEFVDVARAADGTVAGLRVEAGGEPAEAADQQTLRTAELVGIAAAAVVLFLAFGSLFGMLLPLVIALFSVGTGVMAIGLLSHVMDVAEISPTLGTLVGLGVAIDYALFIVTRHRNGIRRGRTPEEACVAALNTSGRAVLFAGATVCVAVLGLFCVGISFLYGVALATTMVVLLSMAAAVTLLPALLGLLGPRVLGRRERRRLAEHGPMPEEPTGAAARWSAFTQRHPRLLAGAAVTVLAVLAIPMFSLRLGSADQGNNPEDTTARQAYDLLAEGFGPGVNGPLQIIAETPTQAGRDVMGSLATVLDGADGVKQATALPTASDTGVSLIEVIPTTSPQDEATDDLIDRLREEVIPPAVAGTSVEPLVGGQTAVFKDFAAGIMAKLPAFIAVIIGLGFVLLLIAFRSLVVPLTAAVMNLLAAAASFGIVVAVFQWGWGSEAIGAGPGGPVESFVPVIMLSLLFGLSMDYQVFLLSRIHEEWVHSGDNHRAVRVGLAETSRVINSAAVIMICVFSAFILQRERTVSEFGLGLAGAVALDAFIIRTVLVPSLMHLLDRANWWLPGWLDRRLPHLAVEPPEERRAVPVAPEPVGAAAPREAVLASPGTAAPGSSGQRLPAGGDGGASGMLAGTVSDSAGPLTGVHVVVSAATGGDSRPRTAVTGPDGRYEFADLPWGDYVVTARMDGGGGPVTREVTLAEGAARTLNLRLSSPMHDS